MDFNRTSSKISRGKLRNCPFLDPVGKGNPGCANWAAMAFQKKHPLMNGLAQEKAVLLEAYKCLGKMRQKTLSQHNWDEISISDNLPQL